MELQELRQVFAQGREIITLDFFSFALADPVGLGYRLRPPDAEFVMEFQELYEQQSVGHDGELVASSPNPPGMLKCVTGLMPF